MNIFLSKPSETIYKIRELLRVPVYIKRRLPSHLNTVIRWGSIREAECQRQFNTVEAIKLISNKPKCRRFLFQAGIPVPKMGDNIFPCIGRPRYHTGGKGFWLCRTPYEVEEAKMEGAEYFSQFYPKTKEYRVHIGKKDGEYKVILYSEKTGDKSGTVIWNHDIGGFKFQHLGREERRSDIINLAKDTIEAVGLDFGCVDILADPLYDEFPPLVVCEVNSAPALSPLGVEKYVEYFKYLYENHYQ